MDLNYFGSVNTTFLALPGMKERCYGHIVFVSSMAGQVCITIDMPMDFILWEMFLVKIVTATRFIHFVAGVGEIRPG